jgi:hypothetical protein
MQSAAAPIERGAAERYPRHMNLPDLEHEELKLPAAERARLAEALLESLESLSAEENLVLWTEEAQRRDAELERDPSRGRPADDVFRSARARLG